MSSPEKSWKCNVCGYVHTGPEPPEMCPICGAPASEFTEIVPDEDAGDEPPSVVAGSKDDKTVSDIMVETMVNRGVTHVFGMVGHSNLGLADAIRRKCEAGQLAFIGIRHEGAAAFAASAFGKLTGRPAACLSIAGPDATNMLDNEGAGKPEYAGLGNRPAQPGLCQVCGALRSTGIPGD